MVEEITEKYTQDNSQPEFIEGFPVTAEEVKNTEDKTFEIVKEPKYIEFQDGDKAKRKLILTIKMGGAEVDYYPNKTSLAKIIKERGRKLSDWIGYKGEFEVLAQRIAGETKDVIYIK